jgi:ribosomal-protein-alanine N-acetyltransferase
VRLRPAKAEDLSAMMVLEQQSPAAAHWSQQQYEKLFEPESAAHVSKRFAWVAEADGESAAILAFLVSHNIDKEWELENIVVTENARRRGVGTLLLSQFIAHARIDGGSAIFLEVRESNLSARTLYAKLGFEEKGLRKSYYSSPTEDAVLYLLRL